MEEEEKSYWFYSFVGRYFDVLFFGNDFIESPTNLFPFQDAVKSSKESLKQNNPTILSFQRISKKQYEECSNGLK